MDCGYLRKRKISTLSLTSDENSSVLISESLQKYIIKKTLIFSSGALFMSMLIAFIIIWVVIPVSFMLSIPFQTFMVFLPIDSPRNANFDKPEDFGMKGVHNFYISTRDVNDPNILTSIGVWLILPEGEMNTTTSTNVTDIIHNTEYDILIYLHGVFANRAKATEQYRVLRKKFLIIAIDHRGYGDSGSNVPMTEIGIANDHLQIYNWVRFAEPATDIYYWGHSLGTGMSTRTLRLLKEQGQQMPKGVVLESPFTSFEDIILNIVFGRLYGWLLYFDATILRPLDINGFHFRSRDNILSIDCPIMILHAEDDFVVPYSLGKKLADIAEQNRRTDQGSVIFRGFSPDFGFGHNDIIKYSGMGLLIDNFKEVCRNFSTTIPHQNRYFNYM